MIGIYTNSNGDVYDGNWEDGKMKGQGVYNYANGDKYTGEWANNEKNGRGNLYFI